ncbi:Aste57867_4760 [Aphanomyces stellatus]|uniref:Aste57867_4760 protein n=1 Tax=Aphanomyces stellatus TaxID=120398 RepID=A0A485KEF3_9STRA|nr:hypothetical protein As57867_004747 [Aphanomyces stellatus]VFT81856.1 Aste57867_4760 [Aphanomyces stellatus]
MKEYFIQKLFGTGAASAPATAVPPLSIFARNPAANDTEPDWEFYPEYQNQIPLPEGIVMDSPVHNAPCFHSPTPASPVHRLQRSTSLETEKNNSTLATLQKSLKRRLSWIRSTVTKLDMPSSSTSKEHVIERASIESLNTPTASLLDNASFLESINEDVEEYTDDDMSNDEDDGDDVRVTFCDNPACFEFETVETLDELVVRISEGFPATDTRPAHAKLLAFCTKSLSYLKYRDSPCAEVFALNSTDISMWRRLGHYDWACEKQEDEIEFLVCKAGERVSNESTTSEESDLCDDDDVEEMPIVRRISSVEKDVCPLVDVMNSVLTKGDECFSVADIEHLCKEAVYPPTEDDEAC